MEDDADCVLHHLSFNTQGMQHTVYVNGGHFYMGCVCTL